MAEPQLAMCIAVSGLGAVFAGIAFQFVRRWSGATAFDTCGLRAL